MSTSRRSLMMPDDLWRTIREEAARETIATGTYVSASELVRNATMSYCAQPVESRVSTDSCSSSASSSEGGGLTNK